MVTRLSQGNNNIVTNQGKLQLIKTIHTAIWLFFNGVIFYFLYAVVTGRVGVLAWCCLGLVLAEAAVLLYYRNVCPLTILARRYSSSEKPNFDIYLPSWLARYNKIIYSVIMAGALVILLIRWLQNNGPAAAG